MAYAQAMLERLNLNWQGFTRHHHLITEQVDAVASDRGFEEELDAVSKIYDDARKMIEAKLKMLARPANPHVPQPVEVTIGTFSGKFHEYTSFRTAVWARVITADYPAHTRIDIIVSALEGEARKLVGEIRELDDAEFDRIWRLLEDRYYDPYLLMRAHIGQIIDLPLILRGAPSLYRDMVNTVTQSLYALSQLSLPTDLMGPIILELVLRKVDAECSLIWEATRPQAGLPTLAMFLSFLDTRIVELTNASTAHKVDRLPNIRKSSVEQSPQNRISRDEPRQAPKMEDASPNIVDRYVEQPARSLNEPRPSRSNHEYEEYEEYAATSEPQSKRRRTHNERVQDKSLDLRPPPPRLCVMNCAYYRKHHLWLCKKFRALNLDERNRVVNEERLCRRCITQQHSINTCLSPKCERCDDDVHNEVLCPKFVALDKDPDLKKRTRRGGRRGKN